MVTVSVEYQKGVLRPLENIEKFQEGSVLKIEIKPDLRRLKGALKGLNISSGNIG
ncbi:MAG: antitoxin family protein [bacterium]